MTLRLANAAVWCLGVNLLIVGSGAHAEQFVSTRATWVKQDSHWLEYGADPGKVRFRFSEAGRSDDMVLLWDETRQLLLRLPLIGGPSAWTTLNRMEWLPMDIVRHDQDVAPKPRTPRPETPL
jgi:hypothetical protein